MLTDYQKYRLYEILPGVSIWLSLLFGLFLSWAKPLWVIYFIIIFDVYWVLKVFNFSFYLIVAIIRFMKTKKINWRKKLMEEVVDWDKKRHIIFLTLFDEDWGVVKTALYSIAKSVYKKEFFILVIAGEERKKEHYEDILSHIKRDFGDDFGSIIGTMHPSNLEDEIPGKGSNLHYSESVMKNYIDNWGFRYEDVIATVFDIDTVVHPMYFPYLTYLYCHHPNPTRSSYQPVAVYNNNMWESPAPIRVMSFGTTFWMMTSLARQDSLVTFSSHSLSFQAIVDVGFHEKRIVSEDSRIFYQCLIRYDGDYEVTPMYLPVSMDTVRDDSWFVSIKNIYKQQRRWAWGAEHIPYLLWEFGKPECRVPFWKKIKWVFIEWEGKWSWCLVALILSIFGRLPLLFASDRLPQWMRSTTNISESALFFNAPHLLKYLMTMALVGLFLSAILSFPLLPKRPQNHPKHKYIVMLLQWALLPITLIFVSAIPAIDSITHMMFGKYLGFNVSQKKRLDLEEQKI